MSRPASWCGGAEALRIADNLLRYQFENGGWDKNSGRGSQASSAIR